MHEHAGGADPLGHADHDHGDWGARGPELISEGEISAPMVDQAVAWLAERLPEARQVLDVGSGPGVAACTMAAMVPRAQVLAADGEVDLLELATERAVRLGVADRFSTRQVRLPDELPGLPPAGLVWVSGVVHHLPDPLAALRVLGRLVRPGGLLAVREGGLPVRFLPEGAAPGLLPRLEAIGDDLSAAGIHPGGVVSAGRGWPDLMREAGLEPAGSRSFLLDLPAPVFRRRTAVAAPTAGDVGKLRARARRRRGRRHGGRAAGSGCPRRHPAAT